MRSCSPPCTRHRITEARLQVWLCRRDLHWRQVPGTHHWVAAKAKQQALPRLWDTPEEAALWLACKLAYIKESGLPLPSPKKVSARTGELCPPASACIRVRVRPCLPARTYIMLTCGVCVQHSWWFRRFSNHSKEEGEAAWAAVQKEDACSQPITAKRHVSLILLVRIYRRTVRLCLCLCKCILLRLWSQAVTLQSRSRCRLALWWLGRVVIYACQACENRAQTCCSNL